ncbi:hypothetical protein MKEN_00458800 [Mycena kentingensis (nom. inval.)]|nr:hypothetical protein MKEN_00458800 [Mycena kentingensis (nom. inval.)]
MRCLGSVAWVLGVDSELLAAGAVVPPNVWQRVCSSRRTPQSRASPSLRSSSQSCLLFLHTTTLDQSNNMPFSYARNPVGLPSRPSMTSRRRSSLSAAVESTVAFLQNLAKSKDVVVVEEEPRFRRSTEEPRKPALKQFDASQLVVYPGFPRTDVLEFEIAVAIEEEEEVAMIPAAMARVSSIRLVRRKSSSRSARKDCTAKKMVRSVSGPAPPLPSLPAYVADEEEEGGQLPPRAILRIEEDEAHLQKRAEEMENQLEADAEALHWMMG